MALGANMGPSIPPATAAETDPSPPRPGEFMPIRLGYVDTPIGQIHYRRTGERGPVVVLLHQTAASSRMYEKFMAALDGEFQLVALDTPGFGASAAFPAQPTIEDLAEVLAAAVAELGISSFHLFGHH